MIRVHFEPAEADRFRRSVRLPERDEPLVEELEIPLDLYPGKLSPVATDLHEREPEELRELGRRIAQLALGADGLAAFEEIRRSGSPLRIAFEESTEAAAAAAVPWELMHDGEEFLAAHPRVHLVRTTADGPRIDAVTTRRPLRLLILWASPRDQPPIDVEWEQIRLALGLGPHLTRREIETFEVLHTTRSRLDEALATGAYDLVYYTGHGTYRDGVGHLCLETDDGTTDLVTATQLARKLAHLDRLPSLVFLNCCWSGAVDKDPRALGRFLDAGRRLLREGVPFVVATLTPVLVSTAQTFMESFFGALLSGQQGLDVERAMAAARTAVLEERAFDRTERQTFFQYLLLTATGSGWAHAWQETENREADLQRILYRSPEYPGHDPARVRRNQLLVRVEAAWAQGSRAVGVHGLGGIGKTVFSAQVLERAVGHAVTGLRAERAVWLDLREAEDLHGSLVDQLCFVLDQVGDRAAAQALRTTVEPAPVGVARSLARSLGADAVVALDNCETLLDEGGEPSEGPARELVDALVRHTGWRSLLTSREPFSLARDGRDPAPVRWLPVEELTPAERGALLRSALRRTGLELEDFPPGAQRRIFQEVAGHPFELGLFLGDPKARADPDGLIGEVHRWTSEYARLGYYVGRVPPDDLPVLHLVATLDEPLAGWLLEALWQGLAEPMDWPQAEGRPKGTLAELARRGLVEDREGSYGVLPVLARYLRAPESEPSLPPARQRLLHRELARAFFGLSEGAGAQARELHAEAEHADPELDAAMAALSNMRLDLLHRAFRHAQQQEEVELTLRLAERLFGTAAGGLPLSRLFAYAQELEGLLDTKVAQAGANGPPAMAAPGYGVVGKAFASLRRWEEALAAYEKSVEACHRTTDHQVIGTTYHQIGIVHEEQREWEPALESYRQAIEWNQKTGQTHRIGGTFHQIGSVHQERREWEPALDRYRQAIEWNQRTGQTHQLGITYHQIGIVHQERREWEPALESYRQAMEWHQKTGQIHEIGATVHQIGRLHQERGVLQEAGSLYLKALDLYARHGFAHPSNVLTTLHVFRGMLDGSDLDDGTRSELQEALGELLREHPVLAQAQEVLEENQPE